MTKAERMRELVEQLNRAGRAYYAEGREIMSNYTYDQLYDELQRLEAETGTVLAHSPTAHVGYEVVSALPKERHELPMLSLDKTKDVEQLRAFIGGHRTLLSWKMDGLTVVLTYTGGTLAKAVTRGNGVEGEVITGNARAFVNVPVRIPFSGELVLRGEAFIRYSDFDRINEELGDADARYKNPRNLCAGSVRQLDSAVTAARQVRFYAFSLVRAAGVDFENSVERQFLWLQEQGFETVAWRCVTADTLDGAMAYFRAQIENNDFPSDGLVALYDDIAYGASLGATAKFPRNAYAFKWADEKRSTHLTEIEWSPSRTGLLNPVAIFEPVELEGTTVSRASVHNVSIVRALQLGVGDTIEVYKANMIIPQIAENLTRSDTAEVPARCPVCGAPTRLVQENDVETLVCDNPSCPAKAMKSYTLFVSRDALNIEGISEAALEKLMAHGLVHTYADLFRLSEHRTAIVRMDGFGEKSYANLVAHAESAAHTTLSRLLFGLGIPNIGATTAKLIARAFDEDLDRVRAAAAEDLADIDGIGPVIAASFVAWWGEAAHRAAVDALLPYLTFTKEFDAAAARPLEGLVFVITGSLTGYANRSALKADIERLGGKVTGSVSAKTSYLINNDVTSSSAKNKKARDLGIPILSEADFLALVREKEGAEAPSAQA